MVASLETLYRCMNKRSRTVLKTEELMAKVDKVKVYSSDEIDKEVEQGKKLLIFDNLVLDYKDFD